MLDVWVRGPLQQQQWHSWRRQEFRTIDDVELGMEIANVSAGCLPFKVQHCSAIASESDTAHFVPISLRSGARGCTGLGRRKKREDVSVQPWKASMKPEQTASQLEGRDVWHFLRDFLRSLPIGEKTAFKALATSVSAHGDFPALVAAARVVFVNFGKGGAHTAVVYCHIPAA